jgi:hypothetical protein
MPQYFFQFCDGDETRDPDGLELADLAAALAVAHHELRQLAAYDLQRTGQLGLTDRIDITDARGRVLESVCVADLAVR